MKNNRPIIFLGTPQFALPALAALMRGGFTVAAVVTRPDEPQGREQIITSPPVKVAAQKYAIPVFQQEKLSLEFWKKELPAADCMVVAAYGKIIPKDILALPRFGTVNIHPSLLPRLRGPSPIQCAILGGEHKTGVSVILLDELMDHGPLLAQKSISLEEKKPRYKELHDTLAQEGADLLLETLPKWFSGEIIPIPQDDNRATFTNILKKDDGRINWSRPAEEIERMVRAFELWPGSWTLWPTDKQIYRIRVEEAEVSPDESSYGSPGHVWGKNKNGYPVIKTGRGSLVLKKLTIESKHALDAETFLRGYPQFMGTTVV